MQSNLKISGHSHIKCRKQQHYRIIINKTLGKQFRLKAMCSNSLNEKRRVVRGIYCSKPDKSENRLNMMRQKRSWKYYRLHLLAFPASYQVGKHKSSLTHWSVLSFLKMDIAAKREDRKRKPNSPHFLLIYVKEIYYSSPFPSSLQPLFQSEAKCEVFVMKISFRSY